MGICDLSALNKAFLVSGIGGLCLKGNLFGSKFLYGSFRVET